MAFTTGNYNLTNTPVLEWEFVVKPRKGFQYPHTPKDKGQWPAGCGWRGECGLETIELEAFLARVEVAREVTRAGLLDSEVIALRLYTGPMFVLYNAVLRGFPENDLRGLWDSKAGRDNRYETTIVAIASGITKLSKITEVPSDRRLYRGLGGLVLPKQFWERYAECQVTFMIIATGDSSAAIMSALRKCVSPSQGAPSGALEKRRESVVVYDIKTDYLQLSLPSEIVNEFGDIAKSGVRVVKEPKQEEVGVCMSVALPVAKDVFKSAIERRFVEAIEALCGGG